MDFKSSNLHFQKDTDSRGMQLNSQKNQTFSMCPFWNWEQIRAWEIWEKMVWIAQRWGSSFLPSASPVPKWCELRAGPSPDKDGKGFLGSGGALELFFWDEFSDWQHFSAGSAVCALDPVQQSCKREILKWPQNLLLSPLNYFFTPFLRRKNCSLMPGIVGSSWEIKVREKGALYSYFILRNSEVQRGHTAGHQD